MSFGTATSTRWTNRWQQIIYSTVIQSMLSQAIDIKLDTRRVARKIPWNADTYRTALLTYLTVQETHDLQFRMSTSSSQTAYPHSTRSPTRATVDALYTLTVLFRKEKTISLRSGETKHCQNMFLWTKATIIQIMSRKVTTVEARRTLLHDKCHKCLAFGKYTYHIIIHSVYFFILTCKYILLALGIGNILPNHLTKLKLFSSYTKQVQKLLSYAMMPLIKVIQFN